MSEPYKHEGAPRHEPYQFVPHNYAGNICHWPVCVKCGLIFMKNDFSRWADKQGCNHKDHPSYEHQRAKTNPF